jgi:hypothetical protein
MIIRYASPNSQRISSAWNYNKKKNMFILAGQTNCRKSYTAKLTEDCRAVKKPIIKDSTFSSEHWSVRTTHHNSSQCGLNQINTRRCKTQSHKGKESFHI